MCDHAQVDPSRPFLLTSAGQYGTLLTDIDSGEEGSGLLSLFSVSGSFGTDGGTEASGDLHFAPFATSRLATNLTATAGGAIVLCYRDENDSRLVHIRASKVGDNGIKPDTDRKSVV